MDEWRRRQYLEAMGIRVWRPRAREDASAAGPGEAEVADTDMAAACDAPATTRPNTEPSAAPLSRDGAGLGAEPSALSPSFTGAGPAPAWEEPPPWTDADLQTIPLDEEFQPASAGPESGGTANPVASMDWDRLQQAVASCRACGLCERRTQTVFGVGDRNADLMLVGEGPGQEEDRRGEPFVGRAGQLLNRMLAAANLRREQVFIANIVKCRPPNNRNPLPEEAAACLPYLARQIELVQPRLLVSLGGVSASNLLDTTDSVGRLRGSVHHYGPRRTPLLVTYHPSYYLRSPADKAKGWQDLQRMIGLLHAGPPEH
jgi:uracil-DNA glycosylase family 4